MHGEGVERTLKRGATSTSLSRASHVRSGQLMSHIGKVLVVTHVISFQRVRYSAELTREHRSAARKRPLAPHD